MANELKCANCCYFWQENDETHPYCHWEARCPDDKAPCEYDDDDYVEDPDYPDAWQYRKKGAIMKLCDCKDWKAVHFHDRTILKKDCPYMSAVQLHELAETEVEPTNRKGCYKVKASCLRPL